MSKKSIILSLLIIVFLISCGAPGRTPKAKDINYKETASEIKVLSEALSDDMTDIEARRYLSKVQKVLLPASNSENKNDLTVIPVNVRSVEAGSILEKVQYLGDIEGDPSVVLYPKLTDNIIDILVENGDFVRKGDVLGYINDVMVRTSKNQAEAGYFSAQSQVVNVNVEYERMRTLFNEKAISQSQWDQIITQRIVAEAGLKQAKAGLEMATTQLGYAAITAPISGYISNMVYEPGDMTTPQKPFASIHQVKTVKIAVNVTESDLGNIKVGQRCEISVNAYPDEVFNGKIGNISPVINPMTRTAQIEIQANNTDLRLKPGMFARVAIITNERNNVLTIAKAATSKQTILQRFGDNLRDEKV
ncbi:MAG: efflux RND transporter periplasmic adaptor subunit, partial [Candidatus Marinimicrobia bacterium]|nr:efflux RND transporter periplasmic adaptor subunit [Candidatus Neomarinimicrobiota bacterium]